MWPFEPPRRPEWSHDEANGVCKPLQGRDADALVEVKGQSNDADLAGTLIHEYTHVQLHLGADGVERAKREVEAEAVAYVVGRYFDLDMSGSAFYLAAWQADEPTVVRERLQRISRTAQEIIECLNESDSSHD